MSPCAGCLTPGVSTTTAGCEAGYLRPTSIGVLLISDTANNDGQAWPENVRVQLSNTGAFARVDRLQMAAGSSLPTLQYLQGYQAVFLFIENYYAGLSDRVVEYWYAGGAVVASAPGICNNLRERFDSEGFALLGSVQCAWEGASFSTSNIVQTSSPLMSSVSSMSQTGGFTVSGSAINGGVVVATWSSGKPLVVRGTKNGRLLVTLYLYPTSSAQRWDLLGPASSLSTLLKNAVVYSACSSACAAACAPGSYTSSGSTCTQCGAGTYSTASGATAPAACVNCAAGAFSSG